MRRVLIIFMCAALMLLCACSGGDTEKRATTDYPASALDITIESCPQSVISLSPAITDIIRALGSDAQLAGVSDGCDNPRQLDRFGSSLAPDIAAIKSSAADLVLATDTMLDSDVQTIRDAGKTVAIVELPGDYNSLAQVYSAIATLMSGEITGPRNASNTFNSIDSKLKKLNNTNTSTATVAVFASGRAAVSNSTIAAQLVGFAGGKLVSASDDAGIIAAAPDIIICPTGMREDFESRFAGISVREFDTALLESRGDGMIDAVTGLNALFSIKSDTAVSASSAA